MPVDNGNNIHIPAPGDIIRVKWQQIDASQNLWHTDVGGINFNDGNHKASAITIDTIYYSI
jgi:hypothetical protein